MIGQSCSFGENHRYAKLKTEQVREIRKLYRPGSRYVGGPALAVRFGVSSPTISRIITYKSWRFA